VTGRIPAVLERYDALFLDLDGVLYRADQPVPGAAEAMAGVRRVGVPVTFLTNNSSRTPGEVAEKLAGFGVAAAPEEVLTSGMATASLLRREGLEGCTAYVLGERGVRLALAEAGIEVLAGEPATADVVVIGWDRSVDYGKLRTASLLVERGARLFATNADASYPGPDGRWPGAGAILAAVTTTTGATATIVGKPSRPLYEAAAARTRARRPLVVGDRLDTDVGGAMAMGWDAMVVFTGIHGPADLPLASIVPAYAGPSLSTLLGTCPPARFHPAGRDELPQLEALLAGAGLEAAGVEDRLDGTVVSPADEGEPDGGLAASACLQDLGRVGLLRSVAVRPDLRGCRLGLLAVSAAVQRGRVAGLDATFAFTEGAQGFFAGLRFRAVGRADLPDAVRGTDQAEACAAATAMVLEHARRPGSP
jgi:HAD superfamily hydrolase (TIGR01450 family)